MKEIIKFLNLNRKEFIETKDKIYWWNLIQLLPSSYNQRSTIMLNYEVLYNMYHSRRHHKLDEWHIFCDWIESAFHLSQNIDLYTAFHSASEMFLRSATDGVAPPFAFRYARNVANVIPRIVAPPRSVGSLTKPPSHFWMNGISFSQLAIFFFVFGFNIFFSLVAWHQYVRQRDVQVPFRLVHHDSLQCLGDWLVILG